MSAGSWHFDSHLEVAISAIAVGTVSVANSKKANVNYFSQEKKKNLMREMARFDLDLGRWSVWICRGRRMF